MLTSSAPPDHPPERLLGMLSTMLIQLNALQTLVDKGARENIAEMYAVRDGLQILEHMTREMLYEVRSSIEDLPLAELEGVTLAEALSRIAEETAETLGLSSRVLFSGVDEQGKPKEHTLSASTERVLYLIAREALYQVEQHTGARKLRLTLAYGPDDVQMGVEDDGINIGTQMVISDETTYDTALPHFAIVPVPPDAVISSTADSPIVSDLRYRLEQLGGTLEVSPQGERGTRVLARVPYISHVPTVGIVSDTTTTKIDEPAQLPSPTPDKRIRILIVETQAVTRAGLHRLLESYPDLQVVGAAADGVQAVSETLELGPQVVLMDSQLPNGQSLEALHQIKQLNLDTKVLLFSTQDREEYLYETLRAGANGYILKDITPDELAQAIRVVARGEVVIQPQLAGKLLSRFGKQGRGNTRYDTLTARELEVLRLLARGLRNKEIAARLYVSERTVNFHLANIYQKLNVSGRTEALSRALEQGLITA